jgi:signal transduction histidine kinase
MPYLLFKSCTIARKTVFITAVIFTFLLTACHQIGKNTYRHTSYFNKIFLQAEHLKGIGSRNTPSFLDSVFRVFPQPGILDLYRKYIFLSDYFIDNTRTFPTALIYCDSALRVIHEHIQEKEFATEYGNALFRRGYLLMELKRYTEAFDSYNRARQLIEKAKDTCSLSAYTFMLGAVCNLQGENLDAARYTKKGIQELEHCSDNYDKFKLMISKMDDAGIFYSRQGMPDSALYYFKAALNYMQKNNNKYLNIANNRKFVELYTAVIYGNMGTAYAKKGDTVTAERLYLASLKTNTKKEYDQGDAQFTWLKLAGLYLTQNRLPEARQMLQQMRYCLDTLPNQANEIKWYRLQFDFLNKTRQFDEVHRYITPYLKLEDSLSGIKSIPQIDVNKEYEHLKGQYELVMLEKQDQLKSLYLVIAIGLSVPVIVIALLLWYHWKRTKKLHYQVSEQNGQMQRALSALEQSQEDNTRMMKIVAHDLRNPIGGITSIAGIMLDEPELSADSRMMLELIKTSGQNSLELVSDLLQIHTRVEELKKEPVDLSLMLQYCIDLLHHKAEAKGQQIDLRAAPLIILTNQEKMWRVVSNLIANAIKFSPSGATIRVSLASMPDRASITVEDHGIGIPAEIADKVFDMFTEAKRPGTAGEQPFGLGLAISKQIVEAHGGKIWFDSKPGNGTTFYVELPLTF